MDRYQLPPQDSRYFRAFAKRIVVGTGLTGLLAGGKILTPAVTQFFHEMQQAVTKGELSILSAAPLLLCIGPAVLGFAAVYRAIRKAQGSPPWDR